MRKMVAFSITEVFFMCVTCLSVLVSLFLIGMNWSVVREVGVS